MIQEAFRRPAYQIGLDQHIERETAAWTVVQGQLEVSHDGAARPVGATEELGDDDKSLPSEEVLDKAFHLVLRLREADQLGVEAQLEAAVRGRAQQDGLEQRLGEIGWRARTGVCIVALTRRQNQYAHDPSRDRDRDSRRTCRRGLFPKVKARQNSSPARVAQMR